jgi:hypothetical protein
MVFDGPGGEYASGFSALRPHIVMVFDGPGGEYASGFSALRPHIVMVFDEAAGWHCACSIARETINDITDRVLYDDGRFGVLWPAIFPRSSIIRRAYSIAAASLGNTTPSGSSISRSRGSGALLRNRPQ